jgi:hypothetical protein
MNHQIEQLKDEVRPGSGAGEEALTISRYAREEHHLLC